MPTYTPNYNLALYNDSTDQAETFLNYRLAQSGPTNSNMTKLDTAIADINTRTTAIESNRLLTANATFGNPLINGGFDFAQRWNTGGSNALTSGNYGPDRWKVIFENSGLSYSRSTAPSTSNYSCSLSKTSFDGKFMVYQIIENCNTYPYRGKQVIFQFRGYTLDPSTTLYLNFGLIELSSSGTADSVPTVVSTWNSNGVNPSLGANLNYIGTPGSGSLSNGQWTTFSVVATIPTTSKNLIAAIWSKNQFPVGDFCDIAEAGIYFGNIVRSWQPRPYGQELSLCQRYYEKTFAVDTMPANNLGGSVHQSYVGASGGSANSYFNYVPFKTTKRALPTIGIYNTGNSTDTWGVLPVAANVAIDTNTKSTTGFRPMVSGTNSYTIAFGHWTAEAEL